MSARVDVLGVGFDRLDLTGAAARIAERYAAGQRSFVITANPEFVMLARKDRELAAVARAADLVVADGTGVLVASRLLGDPLPARVPGRNLVPAVLAAEHHELGIRGDDERPLAGIQAPLDLLDGVHQRDPVEADAEDVHAARAAHA